jgi:membrane protein YdbS with pleckstrin-like domain
VVTAAVASATLVVGRWWFRDVTPWAEEVGAIVYYLLALAVWPLLVLRLAYRMVTYTYRLTDRAVLVDFGSRNPPVPPVPLADVTGVATAAGWLGRLLGVGDVTLTAGPRVVTLVGVRRPEAFAALVRTAAKSAAGP